MTEPDERHLNQQQVQRALRERVESVSGVRISFGAQGSGEQLQVVLSGDDPGTLQAAARDVMRDLSTVPGLGAVTSSASVLCQEIVIRPDFSRAAQQGVTEAAIGQAIRVATSGDYDVNLSKPNLPERQIYIRVELDPKARNQIDMRRADSPVVPQDRQLLAPVRNACTSTNHPLPAPSRSWKRSWERSFSLVPRAVPG